MRTLSESEKREVYAQLLLDHPDRDPVELARDAGWKRPEDAIARMKAREAGEAPTKKPSAASKLSDRDRSIAALRKIVTNGTDAQRVNAARALLDASPSAVSRDGSATLVVFRGREGAASATQQLAADVTPEELAAAIDHVREQRRLSADAQLEVHAIEHGIDADELALAWELFSHAEAKAAALRVYLLAAKPEADDEDEEPIAAAV